MSDDKCPGCCQPIKEDELAEVLPWPGTISKKIHRWHVRCHQDAYYRDRHPPLPKLIYDPRKP